jgi:uncharacterized protein
MTGFEQEKQLSVSETELRSKHGEMDPLSGKKSRPALDRHSRKFISMSPLLVISSSNAEGRADVSPRGDPPGFVHVVDDQTILIPDRPGNNRFDTMANIASNPNVACLFFIPGFDDTLRLNGKARIIDDAALLKHTIVHGKQPKVGILVDVEEVFIHCAKALRRSRFWGAEYRQDRSQMPSIAGIILDQTCEGDVDPDTLAKTDEETESDYKTGLY